MNLIENLAVTKQGAEGKLYTGLYLGKKVIIKERFRKSYRLGDLDEHLTKERMKAEAKSIIRSKSAGVRTPAIYLVDFEHRLIIMEEIVESVTVKDYINRLLDSHEELNLNVIQEKQRILCNEVGSAIGKLHVNGIVHGDLTTSNILVKENSKGFVVELFMIDFGLSQLNALPEDKGVDLYVLERALISTHKNSEEIFELILEAYQRVFKKGAYCQILSKLEEVRARGRKRTMVG